jgi:hypothetical protein
VPKIKWAIATPAVALVLNDVGQHCGDQNAKDDRNDSPLGADCSVVNLSSRCSGTSSCPHGKPQPVIVNDQHRNSNTTIPIVVARGLPQSALNVEAFVRY